MQSGNKKNRPEKYHIIACHVLWHELRHFSSLSSNSFTFHYLEQGLHNTPDILRKELQGAIDSADEECSAILIGYGLCSNGIEGISAGNKRLVVARGHDCITYLLGSRERYKKYFDANPGTYWYSPGWIDTGSQPGKERYERLLESYIEEYGEDNAEYLMGMEQGWFREYSNAVYVDLGLGDSAKYKEYTKQCAKWLKWKYEVLEGESNLIRDFLEGNWDSDRFLIVEPGETIVASHDDMIVRTKNDK